MRNRLDLLAIAVLTLAALVGVIVLAVLQLPIPDALPMVVTAGLGALGMSASPLSRPPADDDYDPSHPEAYHLIRKDTGKALHKRPAA